MSAKHINYLKETKDYDEVNATVSINVIQKYMRQFALALEYMHNCTQIIHRDIKPENILVDLDGTIKVADFGVSQILE